MSFFPPSPRSQAPFDPEAVAELELAPKGWARTIRPIDHRTKDVNRLRVDEGQLVEAKRALRGLLPGDWHAEAFAHHKKKLSEEGRWLAIPGLNELVLKSSQEALDAGFYTLPSNKSTKVRLSQKPSVHWVNLENAVEPEPCQGVAPPPLVISQKTPLEAAGALGKIFKGHPVIVTMEATDFEGTTSQDPMRNGRLQEGEARSLQQYEMFTCTNFVFTSRAANLLCAKARQTAKDRLCHVLEPAIIVADDIVLFRGPAEAGYPFLSQEDQLTLRVLVTGRAVKRPWLQKGEQFLKQDDFLAFSHRLNLMTYQACDVTGEQDRRPVLVLAAAGLMDAENRQPRGGIAQALKTWRSMWSGYFEAVVVACGDVSTASIIDRVVNPDIYMKVLQNQPVVPSASQWHWQPDCMQLSSNPVFYHIAKKMEAQRQAALAPSILSHSNSQRPEKKLGRRASGAGLMFLAETMSETQRPAGAILSHATSRASLAPDSDAESIRPEKAFARSATSASNLFDTLENNNTRASMSIASAHSMPNRGGGRRASLAIGKDGLPEDSRALMERHAKLRMEQTDHEQQLLAEEERRNQNKVAEILAKAWGVGGKRISGMVSKIEKDDKKKGKIGGRFDKEAEKEKKEETKQRIETMTLDKKRQIDSNAAVLRCPPDLKDYIFKQIEKEIKMNNKAKELEDAANEDDEGLEDMTDADGASTAKDTLVGNDEAARVFEEVREMAESLESLFAPHWKEVNRGSLSARTPRGGNRPGLPAIYKK